VTGRETLAAAAALVVLAVSWGLVHADFFTRDEITDLPVYQRYGDRVVDGDVPYADFRVEYPPGALPVFIVPSLLSDSDRGYRRVFDALMFACTAAILLLVALTLSHLRVGAPRAWAVLGFVAVSPLLVGSVLLTRFDLWPAALLSAALAALVAGRDRLGSVLLGAGIAAKLYPVVLLPLLGAWLWRRGGRGHALGGLALAAAVPAVAYLAFLAVDPHPVLLSISRQVGRPLQIESLGAAVLVALHHVAGMPLGWASSHGSQNLTGAVADVAAVLLTLVQIGVLVWLWVRFARGPAEPARLVRYSAAVVVTFVAFGKVLSPQFLIWLVPLVPLVQGRRGLRATGMLAAALVLTQVWFPDRYWDYVFTFDPAASAAVLARDLALVALAVTLVGLGRTSRAVRAAAPPQEAAHVQPRPP
jgi:uncharacterized membrane protein